MKNEPVAWTNKDELAKYRPIIAEKEYSIHFPIPLYTHPAKELHLSLQKDKETGELLAVTYTDDEHRIMEVLWKKPPVKEPTDEEIHQAIRRGFARDGFLSDGIFLEIKELLRNKQGVNSEQVPDFFFMENDLMGKR